MTAITIASARLMVASVKRLSEKKCAALSESDMVSSCVDSTVELSSTGALMAVALPPFCVGVDTESCLVSTGAGAYWERNAGAGTDTDAGVWFCRCIGVLPKLPEPPPPPPPAPPGAGGAGGALA